MSKKYKRSKKEKNLILHKLFGTFIVCTIIAIGSIITAVANNIPCSVVDGDQIYDFTLTSPEIEDILEKAVSLGMPPIEQDDLVYTDDGKVKVDRAVEVHLMYNEEEYAFSTFRGETLQSVFNENNILIEDDAIISVDPTTVLNQDVSVEVISSVSINLNNNGEISTHKVYGETVDDVFTELGIVIESDDIIIPDLDTEIYSNIEISIEKSLGVTFTDGENEPVVYPTYAETVEEFLNELEVELGEDDFLNMELDAELETDSQLLLTRVGYAYKYTTEVTPYTIVYEDDASLYVGQTKIKTNGSFGEKSTTIEYRYENGNLVNTEFFTYVNSYPVNRVVLVGTTPLPEGETLPESDENADVPANTFIDHNGNAVTYSSMMVGECTAYSIPGGTTSTGQPAQVGIVAVNPDVIPYGTRMYVTSADGSIVYGYAVAGDTGGALDVNRVILDLFFDTDEECWSFGRRDMQIYFLD